MNVKAHKRFLLRAIELARRAEGKTYPNPLVGAVIVKEGKIIAEGYHRKAGTLHAEAAALKRAGRKAKGADLYVNLEPCAHYGKTPPCAHAIVQSGIKRVYASMLDPNPLVKGKGFKLLRKKGLSVKTGLCRRQARELNREYVYRHN
jgi:diaminohydroxyphosphoribosylaminopyrimidine deaminase/5-amino-6-(5-phosphoribosylamino)uracil reductase